MEARIVADSITKQGNRLTTLELEYPRMIHAQMLTHSGMLKMNSSSSRAIPVDDVNDRVKSSPAYPTYWGANKRGMGADEEINNRVNGSTREEAWKLASKDALLHASYFHSAGYHKQIVNRITEPFQMIKVVLSATEFDNFFWLRLHEDAQPEIRELATLMKEVMDNSEPRELSYGDWHTPYYEDGWWYEGSKHTLGDALKISASCCAQVSYRKLDKTIEKAYKVHKILFDTDHPHMSPVQHQGTPIVCKNQEGVSHIDRYGNLWSANLKGWVQYRKILEGTWNEPWKHD